VTGQDISRMQAARINFLYQMYECAKLKTGGDGIRKEI
jgi:hypothetical protein